MISDLGLEFRSMRDWGKGFLVCMVGVRGEGKRSYLCLSYLGVCGDVAVVLLGDLGFSLAEVFARSVEGGFGHGRKYLRLLTGC